MDTEDCVIAYYHALISILSGLASSRFGMVITGKPTYTLLFQHVL